MADGAPANPAILVPVTHVVRDCREFMNHLPEGGTDRFSPLALHAVACAAEAACQAQQMYWADTRKPKSWRHYLTNAQRELILFLEAESVARFEVVE